MTTVEQVTDALELLLEDEDVPRSVEVKIRSLIGDFGNTEESISLTVNKAIGELEELSEDVNIPAFVRTQIWGVLSLLSAFESEMVATS